MESDGAEEANHGKGWLPYGYFWYPSKTMAFYLMHSVAPADTMTRTKLARYLQVRK